jgi:hypothetical protein
MGAPQLVQKFPEPTVPQAGHVCEGEVDVMAGK